MSEIRSIWISFILVFIVLGSIILGQYQIQNTLTEIRNNQPAYSCVNVLGDE